MAGKNESRLLAMLPESLRADAKKSSVLLALALVLVIVVVRALVAGKHSGPAAAHAALISGAAPAAAPGRPIESHPAGAQSFEQWARRALTPLSRNLFIAPLDYYPRSDKAPPKVDSAAEADDAQAKSKAAQADQEAQRRILADNLRKTAAKFRLQSIVMGARPTAMVDDELVYEGSDMQGFRVMQIKPGALILRCQGVTLEISMK